MNIFAVSLTIFSWILVLLCLCVGLVDGHTACMVFPSYCNSRRLLAGSTVMGRTIVSSTARRTLVYRGSTLLTSGMAYVGGETLQIRMSSPSNAEVDSWSYSTNEYVFEATNARFQSGGCSGRRFAGAVGNLVMPAAGSGSVSVWGGFAYGYGTVSVTPTIVLTDPAFVSFPPTRNPTARPSAGSPLLTSFPSARPTTFSPTFRPSTNTNISDFSSDFVVTYGDDVSEEGSAAKSVITALGVFLFPILLILGYLYAVGGTSYTIPFATKAYLFSFVSFACGAAAIILVVFWCTDSNTTGQTAETGFLGVPSYYSNPLAWHAALMVGGVFYGQVLAISTWSLLPTTFPEDKFIAKCVHTFFHSISAGCMAAALVAIVRHMYMNNLESLTTMHSWIGVMASLMFGLTYLFGCYMSIMKQCSTSTYDYRPLHRSCGMISFGLIVLAIATGVMNQLPQGQCFYQTTDYRVYPSLYKYPINHYDDIPNSCKLAHGLVVAVIIAALSVAAMVSLRPSRNLLELLSVETNHSMVVIVCVLLAFACGAASVILMVFWLVGENDNDNAYGQRGYVGIPAFDSNPLAWHIAMMAGGVFYSQVFAILTWTVIPATVPKYITKSVHMLFQTATAGCMAFGLICIVRHLYLRTHLSMQTVHAWIGAMASGMFGFNYLFGSTMSLLTACAPDSFIHKALDLRLMHKVFGMASFGLIVCAIVTGVMDQLAQKACYYLIATDEISPSLYKYPWLHYNDMPESCKIAHGMATMIIVSAIAVAIAVSLRVRPVIEPTDKVIYAGKVSPVNGNNSAGRNYNSLYISGRIHEEKL
jgi:hypothetical protein